MSNAKGAKVKRRLTELAEQHVTSAFNEAFSIAAAELPKQRAATFCQWFVEAFTRALERIPRE